ncbi:DMT family transporter [Uliginosibacterium sp. 31-12]|uniref:DMT family transporter n=1 Tax=Uliginosibacterium sp. 31-12 TaxID=3062781 RepID=UPI0026E34F43|nr:DMT family transporter [Uliginosibacterium sp. 31-12]MDO6386288.1 DMT family transporter [Uliginosibacterium sp. 31-12]
MSASRTPVVASLVLLLVTLCWGTTFPAMKAVSQQMPPGLMVGTRWALAALALAPFIDWRNRRLWRDAALLVAALFASFVLQVLGLTLMSAGRNAFITGLNVIMVPLLLPLLGRRIGPAVWVAVVLAGAGIVVMSYEQGSSLLGDALTFACALAFAFYVLGMERFAPRHPALALAGAQAVVMALLTPLWIGVEWWLQGAAYPAQAAGALQVWPELLYLGVICSGLILILQTWAQARASAVQAAVVYALEPFFAAVFSAWWLAEAFGLRAMLGGALVIGAMIVSQWPQRPHQGAEHPHAPN